MKFKELRNKLFEKAYSQRDKLIQQAVGIAMNMGGNMTGAYKKIQALGKKGGMKKLEDHPIITQALRLANESVDEGLFTPAKKAPYKFKGKVKPFSPLQKKTIMKLYKDVSKGGDNAQKALAKLRDVLDVPVNESLQANEAVSKE